MRRGRKAADLKSSTLFKVAELSKDKTFDGLAVSFLQLDFMAPREFMR